MKRRIYRFSCVLKLVQKEQWFNMATEATLEKKEWKVQSYVEQQDRIWPKEGRHILAQYDDDTVVVYQAFSPVIAEYAIRNQKFGGEKFSFTRMSWIKPNFLWMMYRSGWASKKDQEHVLAVRITRAGFDHILSLALTGQAEKAAGRKEPVQVRLQWDPDHRPNGEALPRRAIQLGLKNEVLKRYSEEWIVEIKDVTQFVREQNDLVKRNHIDKLLVAQEQVYPVLDQLTAAQIQVDDL